MKKLLLDFSPIIIFFAVYKYTGDIITATAVLIPATIIQIGISWWKMKKIEAMYLITLVLVIILGGATLIFQNSVFIQWKPTAVNWIFAFVFLGSEIFGSKNLLERMSGKQLVLPKMMWRRLNYMWVIFFTFIGTLNLYVAFSGYYTEAQWVNFKLFGMLGLTFIFIILQSFYFARYVTSPVPETISSNDGKE